MPELQGRAQGIYIENYGEEAYKAYNDTEPNMHHGAKFTDFLGIIPPFTHRPDHDKESLFWVLVFTSILAKPLGETDEVKPLCSVIWQSFQNHRVNKRPKDERNDVLEQSGISWKEILHPKLSCLVKMLLRLTEQVQPEYALLDSQPKPDHLHEAFRRIILEQILAMEDDPIPLTPHVSRDPHSKKEGDKNKVTQGVAPFVRSYGAK